MTTKPSSIGACIDMRGDPHEVGCAIANELSLKVLVVAADGRSSDERSLLWAGHFFTLMGAAEADIGHEGLRDLLARMANLAETPIASTIAAH